MTGEDPHRYWDGAGGRYERLPVAVAVVADGEHASMDCALTRLPKGRIDAERHDVHATLQTEREHSLQLFRPVEDGCIRRRRGSVERLRVRRQGRLRSPATMPTRGRGSCPPGSNCQRHRGSRGGRHDHVRAAKNREQPSRAHQDHPGNVRWQMAPTRVRIDKASRDAGDRRCRIDLVVLDLVAVALELDRAEEELGRRAPSSRGREPG